MTQPRPGPAVERASLAPGRFLILRSDSSHGDTGSYLANPLADTSMSKFLL
jgi:hypothetical protein